MQVNNNTPVNTTQSADAVGGASIAFTGDIDMMLQMVMRDYKQVNEDNAARIFEDMQANIEATQQLNAQLKTWGEMKNGTAAETPMVKNAETLMAQPGIDADNSGGVSLEEFQAMAKSSDPEVAAAGQYFVDNPKAYETLQGGNGKGKQDNILVKNDIDNFKNGKVDQATKDQIDVITKDIQASIDKLNSVNQLKMLALQKAQGNVTQAMESMSGAMKKSDDTKMAIIRNS